MSSLSLPQALAEQQRAQQLAQQQQTAGATPGTPGATAQPQAQPQAATAGLQAAGVPQGTQQGAAAVPNTAVLVRIFPSTSPPLYHPEFNARINHYSSYYQFCEGFFF